MMADDAPWFLALKVSAARPVPLDRWRQVISAGRGTVLACAADDRVEVLETGTTHTAVLIARFAFEDDLMDVWLSGALEDDTPGFQALACAGLPYEGWPGDEVPTIATVLVPAAATRPSSQPSAGRNAAT
ncbi:MAG: hypothetical protein HC866_23445 [Leptolyngbyaceae cyanobacterium RU_5_1]|nr:hypothetical protein [Leptolyngbyaceae cyanobacterium RU_5_1]